MVLGELANPLVTGGSAAVAPPVSVTVSKGAAEISSIKNSSSIGSYGGAGGGQGNNGISPMSILGKWVLF